jgi:hypothetical protein
MNSKHSQNSSSNQNLETRLASLMGFVFPVLALAVMIVIASLTPGSTAPATPGNGLPAASALNSSSVQNSSMPDSSAVRGTP